MMKNYFKFLMLFVVIHICKGANAQGSNSLFSSISNAHEAGTVFQPVSLFRQASGEKHSDIVSSETLFNVNTAQVSGLYEKKPQAVSLVLTTEAGKAYSLEMLRFDPLAEDARFITLDAGGVHNSTFDRGLHYQGVISGNGKSIANLSVFANGDITVMFDNDEGNFVLGKLEDNSGRYILYNDRDMKQAPPGRCATTELSIKPDQVPQQKTTVTGTCHRVKVYWEGDYQLYQKKGSSLTATQNYLTTLFAAMQTLFSNEKVTVELKTLAVWTADDGYASDSSLAALLAFAGSWNNRGDTFNGDIAHLIALDKNNGGIAYLAPDLCNRSYSYAYSDVNDDYAAVPTYSWDVNVVTHETGHNLGSHHTHWCGWNTGTGGACGAIDNCTTLEPGSSCTTCSSTFDNAAPTTSWSGTIMSYCHLKARKVNLANGFGPLPADAIRTFINSTTCLSPSLTATATPTPVCKFNDGAITVSFNSDNKGVAPYTYYWLPGGKTTQNLSTLSATGNYAVTVTDANGCAITLNTTLLRSTAAGCYPAGIDNVGEMQNSLKVYPNPASQNVIVQYKTGNTGKASVKVLDMIGKVVEVRELYYTKGDNNLTIDLNGWAKGVYSLSFNDGVTPVKNIKLIVQ